MHAGRMQACARAASGAWRQQTGRSAVSRPGPSRPAGARWLQRWPPLRPPRPLPTPHLARLDLGVAVLRLQQQLHALDGRHHGLGQRASHAAGRQVGDEAHRVALPAGRVPDGRGRVVNRRQGPRRQRGAAGRAWQRPHGARWAAAEQVKDGHGRRRGWRPARAAWRGGGGGQGQPIEAALLTWRRGP